MLHLFIIDKEDFMITLNKIGDYHNRQVLEIECLKSDENPYNSNYKPYTARTARHMRL